MLNYGPSGKCIDSLVKRWDLKDRGKDFSERIWNIKKKAGSFAERTVALTTKAAAFIFAIECGAYIPCHETRWMGEERR